MPGLRRLAPPVRRTPLLGLLFHLCNVRPTDRPERGLSLDARGPLNMSNQLATLLAEPRPASGCPEYPAPGKSVAVIGAGNIGSHFAAAVARMESVTNIVIVDPDVYEAKNLAGQDITRADVGRPKALSRPAGCGGSSPAISVRPYCCRVEEMPLGTLQVDAIVSCLDNRASRRYLNEMAWRLGVGLVDGAVDAAGLLARVNAYLPGP